MLATYNFENKILKSTCAILAIICFFAAIFNYFIEIKSILILFNLILAIVSFTLWWILHLYKKFTSVRYIFSILLIIVLNLAWYSNYTSYGPMLGLYIVLASFYILIWPLKNSFYFLAVIFVNLIILYFLDSHSFESFENYPTESMRINDIYFGTIASVILVTASSYYAKLFYIRKYDDAKKSDKLKSAFLATMSHELRTPLNAIIGFSNLINKDLEMEKIINYNEIINSSGNHLITIIEELFDLSLIEAGELKISKKNIELHSLLKDVFEIVSFEQEKRNKSKVELKFIHPETIKELHIYTDPSRLKQILINLLKNAIKFTEKGYIHFGYSVKNQQNKSTLTFFVKDTGIGIPAENKDNIFEIFRQVETSLTKKYKGTGIGLSISKKIANALGGTIWLESEIGKGSTFYFTIPHVTEKNQAVLKNTQTKLPTDEAKQKNRISKTILIVEDDELSYQFLKIILGNSGYHSIWAKNGMESVKLCNENLNIDLVLMDINMPVMNGFDATKEIKKVRPNLPVIAQTAHAITGDREKYLAAGCNDYISKPLKKEVLMAKIRALLAAEQHI